MVASPTLEVARRISAAREAPLDDELLDRAKKHLVDSLICILSGATLRPGKVAVRYVRTKGGIGSSVVAGTDMSVDPESAAFANGMCAHADETDDINNIGRVHAGASIIPAAIAMAQHYDRSGSDLLRAISIGYDLACSVNIGAWESFQDMQETVRTPHGLGQVFGAAAAACSLAELSTHECRYALSYTTQQVSGISSFYRDSAHVGKAFASAAMQAHAGVRSAELVAAGFTDIDDVLDTYPTLYDGFGLRGSTERLLESLSAGRYLISTDIKKYPVGMPIQAAAQALEGILKEHELTNEDVARVNVHLPTHGARIVNNRAMPDICLQYVLSILLLDGRLTFDSAHDYVRFRQDDVRARMGTIHLEAAASLDPDPAVSLADRRTRVAVVAVQLADGGEIVKKVDAPRGSRHNPMNWQDMEQKATMVLGGSHGAEFASTLVGSLRDVETAPSVEAVSELLGYVRAG